MNTITDIRKIVKAIKCEGHTGYVSQITDHLERAEYYYKRGRKDASYFNDVIYRTNQAYEGCLKEFYKVHGNKSDAEVGTSSLNTIESYLRDNRILEERVIELFKNYRQQWRNTSTHDYRLTFSGNEALVALTSVTAFVTLILTQILNHIREKPTTT